MSKPIFREETEIEQVRITRLGSSGYAAFRMVFDPDRGESKSAILGIHEHPPRIQPIAPHFHREVEETVYIVSGKGVVKLGFDPNIMEEHSYKAGSCWYVPPGCYHQIVNTGEAAVKMVVSYFRNDGQRISHRLVSEVLTEVTKTRP
ncbi:cupin domain-containing protein [Candidatus Bathyarchaeota archaeon]|jgi:mannose-6-phosphate isomerase-like protein (cupin superfamily)|nr:cupin domain-containing protein [Candidatus Bathyarchaeota archaeon]